jgi:outer membrane lipoprotein-sorting protein
MRWILTFSLAVAAWPAVAEENEAEKFYRKMEQKVRAAKTLQIRFDLRITDALGKTGTVKGTLVLGEGDTFRTEAEGKLFGETVKFRSISDGATMKDFGAPTEDKTGKSARGVGAYFRGALPREGFFLSSLEMDRRADRAPDRFNVSDFKLAGEEKIGERNTQVIQYVVAIKGAKYPLLMKMWIDVETNLPAKLAITGGKSDWTEITETYGEFATNAKVDAKTFEFPK